MSVLGEELNEAFVLAIDRSSFASSSRTHKTHTHTDTHIHLRARVIEIHM